MVFLFALQIAARKSESVFDNPATIGQLVLLVTFLVNIAVQLWRERRQRKWQLEDQLHQEQKLKEHEQSMKQELASKAEEIKANARTRVSDLGTQLDTLLTTQIQPRNPDERRKG